MDKQTDKRTDKSKKIHTRNAKVSPVAEGCPRKKNIRESGNCGNYKVALEWFYISQQGQGGK